MKTQIVQLEAHDDLISIKDKLKRQQTSRALLVWPVERLSLLNNQLELVLLQRHAVDLGVQIGIVSREPEIRFYARKLNIPIFNSIREAHNARWRTRRRRPYASRLLSGKQKETGENVEPFYTGKTRLKNQNEWQNHFLVRVGLFFLGIFSVLLLAAILAPGANIVVRPKIETQEITFTAFTGPEVTTINPSGAVPTRSLAVSVEGSARERTTGQTQVPLTPAVGFVEFTNLTDRAVEIPLGTIIRTEGEPTIRFSTTRAGEVPAGNGQKLDIPIVGLQPGPEGNVISGTIRLVEGVLGLSVTANNPQPTRGGSLQTLASPLQVDVQRARERLLEDLKITAAAEIASSMIPGDILLQELPTLVEIVEETSDPLEGQPGDEVEVRLRAVFEIPYLAAADLEEMAQSVLRVSTGSNVSVLPGSFKFTLQTKPTPDETGSARWGMRVSQSYQTLLRAEEISQAILGLPLSEVEAVLKDRFELGSPPEVTLFPAWWVRIPFLPFRTQVIVEMEP